MHWVGRIDWAFVDRPLAPSATSVGLARSKVIGPDQGAVHTDLVAVALHPDGWLAPHVHSFEEAIYLLEGELLVLIDETVHRLVAGDYALFPTAVRHGLGNTSRAPARFLSLASPQRVAPESGRKDTYFEPAPADYAADLEARAERPPFGSPTVRLVGHYDGTPPQLEALRITDAARGRASAGRDTALVVYSGISVKMLVDHAFGADHTTMFTVDYEIGGAAQAHDHPFEEAYVFLAGEVEAELDGQHYVFRPGDVAFAPTGSIHGFYNTGTERVRWLETQAPQPPARHSYRWIRDWERYDAALRAKEEAR
jgi:quercetin dioxygenase-like cupin family protein